MHGSEGDLYDPFKSATTGMVSYPSNFLFPSNPESHKVPDHVFRVGRATAAKGRARKERAVERRRATGDHDIQRRMSRSMQ